MQVGRAVEKRLHALLSSSRPEDRVAALYLANHLLERSDAHTLSAPRRASLLHLVFRHVSGPFLTQLCAFTAEPRIQRAAMIFLAYCCADASIARERVFPEHSSLCALYLDLLSVSPSPSSPCGEGEKEKERETESERERRAAQAEELSVVLKYLSISCGPAATCTLARALLSLSLSRKLLAPHAALRTVTELLTTTQTTATQFSLTTEESAALRALVTQVLHGAARERVRDDALRCVLDLLRSQRVLCADWTLSQRALTTPSPSPSPSQSGEGVRSFAALLVAVVHAEIHLTAEELLYFARDTQTHAHTHIADTQESEPTTTATVTPQARDEERERERQTARRRCERGFRTLTVCCELVELFLTLFVSPSPSERDTESGGDGEEEKEDEGGLWARASADELQSLQREMKRVADELRDLLAESSRFLATCDSLSPHRESEGDMESEKERETQRLCVTMLRQVTSKAFLALRALAFEDADARDELLRALPTLWRGSAAVRELFDFDRVCVRSDAAWTSLSIALAVRGDEIVSLSPAATTAATAAQDAVVVVVEEMEIAFHLAVSLDVFLQDLVLSELEERGVLDDEGEQLLDAALAVAPELLALPCCVVALLLQDKSSLLREANALTGDLFVLLEKSLAVVHALLTAKEMGLKNLLRSQGVSALQEVLNLPSPLYLQNLHVDLERALRSEIATQESLCDVMTEVKALIANLTESSLAIEAAEQ